MSTAFIFGASGGIGRALVEQLRKREWTVGVVSRHPQDLAHITEFRYEADVADEFAVQAAVYAAAQELPPVELWIYAVGDILSSPVAELKPAAWRRILDANLTGAYLATHYSLPLLAEQAHLIYLGAYSEKLRLPGLSAYAAPRPGWKHLRLRWPKNNASCALQSCGLAQWIRRCGTKCPPGSPATP